ncbi:1,25-dihydroxyvitamin D(3) 24-hydroxylase, mitochondrial-like [Glandiceps talaboti]
MASRTLIGKVAKQNYIQLALARVSSTSTAQAQVGKHDIDETKVKPFEEVPGPDTGFFRTIILSLQMVARGDLKKPWSMLAKFRQEYGPIWKQGFGSFTLVTMTDPVDVEKAFRNDGKYPMRLPFQPWVEYRNHRGHAFGVLLQEGADWHRHRSTLSKRMMRPKEVVSYNDTVNEVVTDMLNKVIRVRQSDNVVPDIENIIFSWALESACAIILDKKMNLLDDKPHPEAQEFIQAVHDMFGTTIWLFLIPAPLQKKLNTRIWKKHVKAWDTIFATAKKLIDEKMNEITHKLPEDGESEEETDFITYMVSQGTLETAEIYGNVTDLLAAAVDTTSNTIIWSLYCLAKHPEVQKSLHEEVSRVVPRGEIPTHKHVNQMPYLKAILKESMRMYPTVVNNGRILENDIVIRGYNIPAKTGLIGSNWLMGRDPVLFEDPLEFKPERWIRDENEHFDGFRFLPFGFGPRMCIGKRLAELEIHLALARISQQFTLEATTDVEPMITTITQPDRPLNLKFMNRAV